jgi:hypothetical protein
MHSVFIVFPLCCPGFVGRMSLGQSTFCPDGTNCQEDTLEEQCRSLAKTSLLIVCKVRKIKCQKECLLRVHLVRRGEIA